MRPQDKPNNRIYSFVTHSLSSGFFGEIRRQTKTALFYSETNVHDHTPDMIYCAALIRKSIIHTRIGRKNVL